MKRKFRCKAEMSFYWAWWRNRANLQCLSKGLPYITQMLSETAEATRAVALCMEARRRGEGYAMTTPEWVETMGTANRLCPYSSAMCETLRGSTGGLDPARLP